MSHELKHQIAPKAATTSSNVKSVLCQWEDSGTPLEEAKDRQWLCSWTTTCEFDEAWLSVCALAMEWMNHRGALLWPSWSTRAHNLREWGALVLKLFLLTVSFGRQWQNVGGINLLTFMVGFYSQLKEESSCLKNIPKKDSASVCQ